MKLMLKKLQRSHSGQVCALRCHPQNVYQFASAAWDNTLRVNIKVTSDKGYRSPKVRIGPNEFS